MPELLVMRHAKSRHDQPLPDRDRPLAPRGEKAARVMGRLLTRIGAAPELILTSPARRAVATARLAAAAGGWDATMLEDARLYAAGADTALEAIVDAPAAHRLLIVGHEPTWSELVNRLVGGGRHRMVTAAVACIETARLDPPADGVLLWLLAPRWFTDSKPE